MIAEVNNNICNKLHIVNVLSNGYQVYNTKWAFIGAYLYYGNNQCLITDIQGNNIIVDNVIPTPNNYIFLEKPTQLYTNERLVDVLSNIGVDGYRFFVIDNELNQRFPTQLECQLTTCIQYYDYTQHKQAVRACMKYNDIIIDGLHRHSSDNPININSITIFHNISAALNEKLNNQFNALHAAVVTDYIRS